MKKPTSAEQAAKLYGNRFLTEDAPDKEFPSGGMSGQSERGSGPGY
jgi:hypothetical protein